VRAFYAERAAASGVPGAKTGAVTVVRRTSSDLRLNPHLHVVFLDGTYTEPEEGAELAWHPLGHLKTTEVGEVLAVDESLRAGTGPQMERVGADALATLTVAEPCGVVTIVRGSAARARLALGTRALACGHARTALRSLAAHEPAAAAVRRRPAVRLA
jgi:hypothetical protein